jgi:hypothetical protein
MVGEHNFIVDPVQAAGAIVPYSELTDDSEKYCSNSHYLSLGHFCFATLTYYNRRFRMTSCALQCPTGQSDAEVAGRLLTRQNLD